MFKLCLWRKRVAARVVWSQAKKEKSEDKVSSPMFCSCKPQTGEERKVAKGQERVVLWLVLRHGKKRNNGISWGEGAAAVSLGFGRAPSLLFFFFL